LERKRTETDLDNFTDLSIGEDWDPIFSDLSVLRKIQSYFFKKCSIKNNNFMRPVKVIESARDIVKYGWNARQKRGFKYKTKNLLNMTYSRRQDEFEQLPKESKEWLTAWAIYQSYDSATQHGFIPEEKKIDWEFTCDFVRGHHLGFLFDEDIPSFKIYAVFAIAEAYYAIYEMSKEIHMLRKITKDLEEVASASELLEIAKDEKKQ